MKCLSIFCFLLSIIICYADGETEIVLKCIKCSSDIDAKCAQNPDELKDTQCNNGTTHCFTEIDQDGKTIRGCNAEECLEINNCLNCTEARCNNKVYPIERPICRQCHSDDTACINILDKGNDLPCVKYIQNDTCYTSIHDDGKVGRGCISDLNIPCKDPTCVTCKPEKDHACNNDLIGRTCYNCSSEDDNKSCIRSDSDPKDCKIDTNIKKCNYLTKNDEPGNCFTFHKDGIVKRGCAPTDKGLPTDAGNLKKCPNNNCNIDCIPDLKCFQCKPGDDCSSLTTPQQCPPYTTFCQQCESEDHKELIRQCGDPSSKLHCTNCDEEGCNKEKTSCYSCDSQQNPNCALWQNYESFSKACPDGDNCTMAIRDGHTVRGCSSQIKCDENDSLCQTCDTFNCNGGLFPSNRRICYQCTSTDPCNAGTDSPGKNSAACTIYDPEEKCYMFGTENAMTRGCSSDKNIECTTNCVKCEENNCNDSPYKMKSKMSCIKCNAGDEACEWGHKKEKAINCGNELNYFDKEACFTLTHENNTVTRDCARNSDLCKDGDEKCIKCDDESGCNNENIKSQKCIRCVSAKPGQESCADTAQDILPTNCSNPIQPFEIRGCYTEKYFGTVFRGCGSDLMSKDLESCKNKDFQSCVYCDEEGCNNKAPNSGVIINVFSAYTLILLYLINKKIIM